jgi:hypothetical protein
VLYSIICGALAGLLSALYELYDNDNFLKYGKPKICFLIGLSLFAGGFIAYITLNILQKFVDLNGITQGVASIAGFGGKKTISLLQKIFSIKVSNIINGGSK